MNGKLNVCSDCQINTPEGYAHYYCNLAIKYIEFTVTSDNQALRAQETMLLSNNLLRISISFVSDTL